ncbi:MAG: GAF domain-containing protein, partial [Candidatus Methylomirabilia bacterium]
MKREKKRRAPRPAESAALLRQAEPASRHGTLRKNEQAAWAFLEAVSEGVVAVDGDGRIVLVNARAEEMFGYSRHELLGQTIEILVPERFRSAHVQHRAGYFAEPRSRPMGRGVDLAGRRKDGSEFPVEIALSFIETEDGVLAISLITDISERKRMEGALIEAQTRLREVIEHISEGFALYDPDDRLVLCNSKYREIYAQSADLLVPGVRFENLLRAGVERGQFVAAIGRMEEWVGERLRHHRNPVSPIEQELAGGRWLQITERRTQDGSTVGIRTDITELKQREQELAEKSALLESRVGQLHTLTRVSQMVSSTLDVDEVLRGIARAAGELLDVPLSQIWIADETAQTIELRASSDDRLLAGFPVKMFRYEQGAVGWAAAHRCGLEIPDVLADERFVARDWARAHGFTSLLEVPILFQDSLLGILAFNGRQPFRFGAEDQKLIDSFAAAAAVAIRNARLFEETERRRREAESLAEVGRLMSQSLDPGEVGQRIVDSLLTLFGALSATLYKLESESGDLVSLVVSGAAGPTFGRNLVFPRGTGVVGLAIRERHPVTTPNLLTDSRISYTPEVRARIEQAPFRAILAVPLLVKDRVIGALGIGDRTGRVFTDEEIRLAEAFADQAALALENARLYHRAGEHAQKLTALSMLTRFITSTQESQEVFKAIAQVATTLLGAKMARVWVDDPVSRALRVEGSFGVDPDLEWQMTDFRTFPYGRGVVGRVFESRVPEYIPDIQQESRWENQRLAKEAGLHACAGLPLITGDQAVGVLAVLFGDRRQFTAEEKELIGLLADHAGIAIQNARLLGESRTREARLESLLEVARQLSRFQPSESLLGSIAEACGQLLGVDAVGFRLVEGADLVVAGISEQAKEVMATPRIKIGGSLTGIVATTGEPLIVMDPGNDPRAVPAHAEADRRLGYRAFLGVPVKV